MKRIVFIQNLIAPYRSHFFNILYSKDSRFKVYYMGKTEKDRNWKIEDIKISHDFWLDRWGIYFTLLGFHIHINPILVLKVLCSKSVGEIILGGSWCDLNVLALVLAKRLRLTKKRYHIWAEANYLTSGARNDNRLKQSLRCFVYGAVDGFFIVPGKMALITFEKWRNQKYYKPELFFPTNLVMKGD